MTIDTDDANTAVVNETNKDVDMDDTTIISTQTAKPPDPCDQPDLWLVSKEM